MYSLRRRFAQNGHRSRNVSCTDLHRDRLRRPVAGRSRLAVDDANLVRLAVKIFLASLVPLLILIEVASWSLTSLDHLVQTNRRIVSQTLPALRREATAREAMASLVRLHGALGGVARSLLRDAVDGPRHRAHRQPDGALGRSSGPPPSATRSPRWSTPSAATSRWRPNPSTASSGSGCPTRRTRRPCGGRPSASSARSGGSAWRSTRARGAPRSRPPSSRCGRGGRSLLALPLSGALALVLSFVIAIRVTRVLRQLAAASQQIAQGALEEPVVVTGATSSDSWRARSTPWRHD